MIILNLEMNKEGWWRRLNKKYSALELLDFPVKTRFKVNDSENLVEIGIVDKIKGIFTVNNKLNGFGWAKEQCIPFNELWLATEFIKIQQPVSFMDVVDSDKKCRVDHEFIESIKKNNQAETVYNSEFKKGEYLPLNYLMCILGGNSTENNIKEIIKKGKWYLEDKIDE